MHRAAAALIAAVLSLSAVTAMAATGDEGLAGLLPQPKPAPTPLRLPPPPRADALVRVPQHGELEFFIDPASMLRVSATEVRYTLVARSDHGADNVGYEAFDCARPAWRVEALWLGGRWQPQPQAQWIPVDRGLAGVHGTLDTDYLCSEGTVDGGVAELRARLRRGARIP